MSDKYFRKKWLLISTVGISLFPICFIFYHNSKNQNSNVSSTTDSYYNVKDQATINNVTYTLDWVMPVDVLENKSSNYIVETQYTVKNQTGKPLRVGSDLTVYDINKEQSSRYSDKDTAGKINDGESISLIQYFELNHLGELELTFAPMLSHRKTAQFKVTLD